jgi:hypothetical protein
MIAQVRLDPHGENTPDLGFVRIADEIAFLRSLDNSAPLLVQGVALCNWVVDVARARGWRYSWQTTPSVELVNTCPDLTQEQAKKFILRIGGIESFKRPLSILDLAVARWPETNLFGKTEAEQAWSWLMWRACEHLDPDEEPIVRALGTVCTVAEAPELQRAFTVSNAEEAWQFARAWLCCDGCQPGLPSCPTEELPTWAVSRLASEWKIRVVQTSGDFFRELLDSGSPTFILKLAAPVACAFYRNNSDKLTPERIALIRPFLRFQDWDALLSLLPVKEPGPAPTSLPELFEWYSNLYLPFRLRGCRTPEHFEKVRTIGREFGLWYLRFYSNARTGATGGKLLSWSRTAELEGSSSSVNLLLVLDGLGCADAQQILQLITNETSRLSVDEVEILLAPLPTITRFAKPSLMAGVNPAQAFDEGEIGAIQTRDPDVIKALNEASAGTVVIWSLLEPDKTYHSGLDEETIRSEVSGRLRSVAQRVSRIVNEVDSSQRLRISVTTDHGRLLSNSRRVRPVPSNMKAHGRAAWGPCSVPFDADGIYIDQDLAYIDAQRFGLPEPSAIMLSDDAFLMSDGRTGVETFPHGGVFPEEVLIPWIRFTRDRGPITISIRITGKGVAGASGKLTLEVTNASDVPIEIVQLNLLTLNLQIEMNLKLKPFKQAAEEWSVSTWPQKKDLPNLMASVTYVLPAGERQTVQATPVLTAEEMYSRETILDDLL